MNKYAIQDDELDNVTTVTADGMIEAINSYLPWEQSRLTVTYDPRENSALIRDMDTDFQYLVQKLEGD